MFENQACANIPETVVKDFSVKVAHVVPSVPPMPTVSAMKSAIKEYASLFAEKIVTVALEKFAKVSLALPDVDLIRSVLLLMLVPITSV